MDLRVPSGWFFTLIGVILLGYDVLQPDARARLTAADVNLYCGFLMLAFGAFLLLLARRGARS
jgi:hypothetical protein